MAHGPRVWCAASAIGSTPIQRLPISHIHSIYNSGPWSLTHFLKTLTLLIILKTVSARDLIFHMNIPCDKTFRWVPFFFIL